MNHTAHRLVFFALVTAMASLAYGINYAYLSHYETTEFGDRVRWWSGDTITGPIHTNSQFAMMQTPVFYDVVSQCADDFAQGPGTEPQFYGPPPVFNAPPVNIPEYADGMRSRAGSFLDHGSYDHARVRIEHTRLLVWWGMLGVPVDTTSQPDTVHFSAQNPVVWFECPIRICGILDSTLILGSSDDIGLEDNILYASSDPITGAPTADHNEKFALVSEGDIKVLNTPANGREDSNFMGPDQTDPNLTSIAINGFLFALGGSFTF